MTLILDSLDVIHLIKQLVHYTIDILSAIQITTQIMD